MKKHVLYRLGCEFLAGWIDQRGVDLKEFRPGERALNKANGALLSDLGAWDRHLCYPYPPKKPTPAKPVPVVPK